MLTMMNDQQQQQMFLLSTLTEYFLPILLLSSMMIFLIITCTKPRPVKDRSRSSKKVTAEIVPKEEETIKMEQPSPAIPNPPTSPTTGSIEPPQQQPQHQQKQTSSKRKKKKKKQQLQQQPSASGAKSKEIVDIQVSPDNKKNSNEKITSTDEPKKSIFKGGGQSAENIKQSVFIDTELRREERKNLTSTTVTKEQLTTANSTRRGKRSKRLLHEEYDKHRAKTPAIFPDEKEKNTTISKVEFHRTNPGTDDEGLFRKPTDVEETVENEKNQNQIKPQKFDKNEKQKKIEAGMKKKPTDYPTMADVVSDWTSEKEVDGKKKAPAAATTTKTNQSGKEHREKKTPTGAATAAAKGSVKATK